MTLSVEGGGRLLASEGLSEALTSGANSLGLSLDAAQIKRLLSYMALIQKWNKVYNLTALREPDEIPAWDGRPTDNFKEFGESLRFFPVTGDQSIKYKPTYKNSNGFIKYK